MLDSTSDILTAELIHRRVHSNTNSHIQPAHVWPAHHDTAGGRAHKRYRYFTVRPLRGRLCLSKEGNHTI